MRISIIGPSGSGKTTLANRISQATKVLPINLDSVCFELNNKKNQSLDYSDYIKKIESVIKNKSWIIEGLQPIEVVFEAADIIVWLRPTIIISLFRQWKRFVKDPLQRERYGFKNNILLSIYILRQYFGNPTEKTDPKKTWIKSVDKLLSVHQHKTIIVANSLDERRFLMDFVNKEFPEDVASQVAINKIQAF